MADFWCQLKKMKAVLIVLVILSGAYFLASNFPNGTYHYEWNHSSISVRITENYLVFRDSEYTKYITIKDGNNELTFAYWAETYPLKIFKRRNGTEIFWVIDDFYRGISRSKNGNFQDFICPDCTGIETTYGENILEFHFENKELKRVKIN